MVRWIIIQDHELLKHCHVTSAKQTQQLSVFLSLTQSQVLFSADYLYVKQGISVCLMHSMKQSKIIHQHS